MNKNFFNKILLRFVIIILAASISLILSGQSDHIKQKQIELVNKIYQLQRTLAEKFKTDWKRLLYAAVLLIICICSMDKVVQFLYFQF